jgi:glycosyltransferase involved in cell wall biosynthesis
MPGYVPHNELPLWYSASEIFVYPSLYEGFGLPPLEAMACRTPVIVSNVSSLPEVVGSDGVLVPPTEIDAWLDALAELLDNHESRDDWAARGELRAADFTWLRTAQQNVAAYYRALNLRS